MRRTSTRVPADSRYASLQRPLGWPTRHVKNLPIAPVTGPGAKTMDKPNDPAQQQHAHQEYKKPNDIPRCRGDHDETDQLDQLKEALEERDRTAKEQSVAKQALDD